MKINIKKRDKEELKSSFSIRLEFIVLLLEVLKLQGYINTSWLTILLILVIPMIIGKILIFYCKRHIDRIKNENN